MSEVRPCWAPRMPTPAGPCLGWQCPCVGGCSLTLSRLQREQDSRDVVCGIRMDKVWDKPEAKRIFGILPNCTHAHCLGCLRTWRKRRRDFPRDVTKSVSRRGQQGGG